MAHRRSRHHWPRRCLAMREPQSPLLALSGLNSMVSLGPLLTDTVDKVPIARHSVVHDWQVNREEARPIVGNEH
jgi:hypothetical protein